MKNGIIILLLIFSVACTPDRTVIQQTPAPQVYAAYSFYNETPVSVSFPSAGTYVNLTNTNSCVGSPGMCDGYIINVQQTGFYATSWHASFKGGPTVEYHAAIGVNGAEKTECHGARVIGTGGDVGNMGGTCILHLTLGDQVTLMLENEDNTQSINVQDANYNVVMI